MNRPNKPSKLTQNPVTDNSIVPAWSAATGQNIRALCGDDIDKEEVLRLAELIAWHHLGAKERSEIEAVTAAWPGLRIAPQHRSRLIDAAILVAADPVFLAAHGPDGR
jgi:hypothetical protein